MNISTIGPKNTLCRRMQHHRHSSLLSFLFLNPKKTLGCLLFLIATNTQHCSAEKRVFGAWVAGFGNVFMGTMNNLAWCKENNIIPVVFWDSLFPYYQPGYNNSENAWEYYFEPTSAEQYMPGDFVHRVFSPDHSRFSTDQHLDKNSRNEGKKTIDKYIKVKAPIQKKINDFYNQNMQDKKTIGIHLRGTDIYIETPPTNPMLIFKEANKQADLIDADQFLVATDEYRLLELAKKELNRPVIYYDCERSTDGQVIVYAGKPEIWPDRKWAHDAKQGEDFLIEFMLLSKCSLFIHSRSNASSLPFYFNPDLPGIYFSPQGKIIYF